MLALVIVLVLLILAAAVVGYSVTARVIRQFERGVVFRLGRVQEPPRPPGLTMIVPLVDRLRKVNVQLVTLPIPAQEGITRDNVTVRVDAVVYFRVSDPIRATVQVQDYQFAVSQVAQTSLRSIIGKSELDDLLSSRERLNEGLELMIDSPAVSWGIEIDRVEIKDVALPESMKRSMSRQAEAERERRSRIITADGELQASHKLASAAKVMSDTPAALQLRLLQTIVEVAAEKNSTLVLPFPVEMLRFFEQATGAIAPRAASEEPASVDAPEASEVSGRLEASTTPESPAEVPSEASHPAEVAGPVGVPALAVTPGSPATAAERRLRRSPRD